MKKEVWRWIVRVLVEVIDPGGVEKRGSTLNAVDLIAFGKAEIPPDRLRPDP